MRSVLSPTTSNGIRFSTADPVRRDFNSDMHTQRVNATCVILAQLRETLVILLPRWT